MYNYYTYIKQTSTTSPTVPLKEHRKTPYASAMQSFRSTTHFGIRL